MARMIDADALKERFDEPYNWTDSPEEIQAVLDWDITMHNIDEAPTIPAIPVEWLKEHVDGDIRDSDGNTFGRRRITVVEALSMWRKEQGVRTLG